MSESVKIIRIFIGSPSGLESERRAARDVVDEVNKANSEHWGCELKLVGWEDTIPGYQRPQSLINMDLDKCQYFIGVLWNRWGTKPDLDDAGFTSGFEEEFCRARNLSAAGSMKDIALYFKDVIVPNGMEPGPEIKKVKDFRAACISEKRIFFRDFEKTAEFRDLVRMKLTEIGWRESKRYEPPELGNSEEEQSPKEISNDILPAETKIFDQKALDFIMDISTGNRERDEIGPHEVARFRLIAASLQRSGNDEVYLGNHDANLIFRHRNEMLFSAPEIRALVNCGIVGFYHQNVPLWRWLSVYGPSKERFEPVKILAIFGSVEEQKNAINLLQILGESVPELWGHFTKEKFLTHWLGAKSSAQIFDVAAEFLAANGKPEDIEIINKFLADAPTDKKAKLNSIIATIKTRSSPEDALQFICENGIENMPTISIQRIFSVPSSLSTDSLLPCVTAKPDGVRLRAVKLLIERKALVKSAAEDLLTDSNHEIRLLAVEYLRSMNSSPDDETIKKILTVKKGRKNLGLFAYNEVDDSYYNKYIENRLNELDFDQLSRKVAEGGPFNYRELFALYRRFGRRLADEIRNNLRDKFSDTFDKSVERNSLMVEQESYRKEAYDLKEFYQVKVRSGVLAILCSWKNKSDIDIVRWTLDVFDVTFSNEVLAYLAKFGDWSDVRRIERLRAPMSSSYGLLHHYNAFADEKAAAIFEIAKSRIADLIKADISISVKNSLVRIFPKNVFNQLADDTIIAELDAKDDEYRALFALRCVESLPKHRIEKILDLYVNRESQRYYNSIHWLDLGASFPKIQANEVVRREMNRRNISR